MKTLIELYVNEQFDDLLAAMVFKPERVVFLCAGFMPDRASRESVGRFVKENANGAETIFLNVGNKSVEKLFEKIREIEASYPDCAVEMTGGPAGMLVAAERFCEGSGAKAFYFDRQRGRFRSIHGMEAEIEASPIPKLSVKTLISMGGGLVTGCRHSTRPFAENEECVRKILGIYSQNLRAWNSFSEYLQFGCKHYYDSRTQLYFAPMTLLNNSSLLLANRKLMLLLKEAGAIEELASDGENVSFRFKNGYIKEILTTVGMCLELFIYTAAKDSGLFDSVEMSVLFDWDGIKHLNFNDTTNEIDVIMTKGAESWFVSCKTARPDTRDLYEIDWLAEKFGGRSAVGVLATATDLSGEAWANYMRARDMGVVVIEREDVIKGASHVVEMLTDPKWYDEKPVRE
ncbi:MAG: DUF1887 family protein [Clostridiales bacterium]|nr:DUF1887 family protein [Clostridiales bacterium]